MPDQMISKSLLSELLMGGSAGAGEPGVFESVVGFKTGTSSIKAVHVMNDLAQSVLGGCPQHRGDHLCRVIREHKAAEEPTSTTALWEDKGLTGEVARRAYRTELAPSHITALRSSARAVLNHDGGMYQAGTGMASGLATHRDFLGKDGFRRFGLGEYLTRVLGEEGQDRLRSLYDSDDDPVSRFLAPLRTSSPLITSDKRALSRSSPTALDLRLGERLGQLMKHPLSKPTLLRYLALGGSLGLVLRILGAGRGEGCPMVLALPEPAPGHTRPARLEAVQSYARSVDALDRAVARTLARHPRFQELVEGRAEASRDGLTVLLADEPEDQARAIVRAAREAGNVIKYWPEGFAQALGRRTGCVLPRSNRAGWPSYLALTEDLIEVVVLMYTDPGASPRPWRELWAEVRAELGLVIGSDTFHDMRLLRAAGVVQLDAEAIGASARHALRLAVSRGVARYLPDGGAEAGGALQ